MFKQGAAGPDSVNNTSVKIQETLATKETPPPVTFLMEPLLLVQDDQFAVLVSLLQHVLALFDVAVVVLQAQQGGHQGHVRLQRRQDFSRSCLLGSPGLLQAETPGV